MIRPDSKGRIPPADVLTIARRQHYREIVIIAEDAGGNKHVMSSSSRPSEVKRLTDYGKGYIDELIDRALASGIQQWAAHICQKLKDS